MPAITASIGTGCLLVHLSSCSFSFRGSLNRGGNTCSAFWIGFLCCSTLVSDMLCKLDHQETSFVLAARKFEAFAGLFVEHYDTLYKWVGSINFTPCGQGDNKDCNKHQSRNSPSKSFLKFPDQRGSSRRLVLDYCACVLSRGQGTSALQG